MPTVRRSSHGTMLNPQGLSARWMPHQKLIVAENPKMNGNTMTAKMRMDVGRDGGV